MEKVKKIEQRKPMEYHFGHHWQVKSLVWNMPANINYFVRTTSLRDGCVTYSLTSRSSGVYMCVRNC